MLRYIPWICTHQHVHALHAHPHKCWSKPEPDCTTCPRRLFHIQGSQSSSADCISNPTGSGTIVKMYQCSAPWNPAASVTRSLDCPLAPGSPDPQFFASTVAEGRVKCSGSYGLARE